MRRVLVVALVLLPVAAVYWQAGRHPFVNWDDNIYVYGNPRVQGGLSAGGVSWAFRATDASNWHPLTWLSHMADVSLFGMDAGWHHRVNVLFHLANTALLFLVLQSMTGALWRSALVAALFGVHPLHVESVAWVAERKDVLSTLFWLLATLSYVRYARRPDARRYAAVVALFALGLMSKPMLVTLPFTLLLLDYWPLGRLSAAGGPGAFPGSLSRPPVRRLVAEKLPLLVLAAVSSIVTYVVQAETGATRSWASCPPGWRVANAIVSGAAYLGKAVWPSSLCALYPSPAAPAETPLWPAAAAFLFLATATAAALRARGRRPWAAVGWLWYLGTLVPVIGLVQVGPQAMADRYTYVPLVGVLVLAAWEAAEWSVRLRFPRAAPGIAGAAAVAALAAASWVQAGYWKDGETLFRRALEVTRDNWVAHNNLGATLYDHGRLDEAYLHFRAAARIKPDYAEAHNNLGTVLFARRQYDEAFAEFREAVRLRPGCAEDRNNLGLMLAARGRLDEAVAEFREAVRLRPDYAEARNNLENALGAARPAGDPAGREAPRPARTGGP